MSRKPLVIETKYRRIEITLDRDDEIEIDIQPKSGNEDSVTVWIPRQKLLEYLTTYDE